MKDPIYIIAEAGVNHNGDMEIARVLIDAAKEAGADAIKFQTFRTEEMVTKKAPSAEYQIRSGEIDSQFIMLKKLELSPANHQVLMAHCSRIGIQFLSSAFDLSSLEFLAGLDLPLFKIASGEITNLPFLRAVARWRKPVILSSGMCYLGDIEAAIQILVEGGLGLDQITVLHCSTEYPAPYEDVNLRAMNTIAESFGVRIGYSDHTEGIEIAIAASAMGASVIEKHFTLDRNMIGPDHMASLEPEELKQMVRSIRNLEIAMGSRLKRPSPSEKKNVLIARKSIVAALAIKKGECFTESNLTTKRPGTGISPMRWDEILGRTALRDYQADDLIEI